MKLNLIIPGIPQPKQSARMGTAHKGSYYSYAKFYQSEKVKKNERNIALIVLSQLHRPFTLLTGAIRVNKLHFIFPPLKGFSKAQKQLCESGAIIPKTTKPDLTDNLNKGLFDAMEGIVYENDSQIVEMNNVKKFYGLEPRIEIELEEI